jgi:hypothetical protein
MKPSWSSEFCSEPCKDLWTALTKYNMAMISKVEAKSIVSNLDLKPIDTYADCVKRDYNIIMEPEKKLKRNKRIEIKPIDEFIDVEPAVVESIIAEVVEPTEHEVVVEKENE